MVTTCGELGYAKTGWSPEVGVDGLVSREEERGDRGVLEGKPGKGITFEM
ncbi:mCG1050008 [Mus musculus]|nr:mCG1050008 [Mus musculus]